MAGLGFLIFTHLYVQPLYEDSDVFRERDEARVIITGNQYLFHGQMLVNIISQQITFMDEGCHAGLRLYSCLTV